MTRAARAATRAKGPWYPVEDLTTRTLATAGRSRALLARGSRRLLTVGTGIMATRNAVFPLRGLIPL
jgi:hypothetical protein